MIARLFRLRHRPLTTDPDPYTRLDRMDGLDSRRPASRPVSDIPPSHVHPIERAVMVFDDGRAYGEGRAARTDDAALAAAMDHLFYDGAHGARRAMLVLAGRTRVDVLPERAA